MPAAHQRGISGTNFRCRPTTPQWDFCGLHARRFGTLLSHQQPACGHLQGRGLGQRPRVLHSRERRGRQQRRHHHRGQYLHLNNSSVISVRSLTALACSPGPCRCWLSSTAKTFSDINNNGVRLPRARAWWDLLALQLQHRRRQRLFRRRTLDVALVSGLNNGASQSSMIL